MSTRICIMLPINKKVYTVRRILEEDSPIVKIINEVDNIGLYIEFEDGNKEVVLYSQLKGWREVE